MELNEIMELFEKHEAQEYARGFDVGKGYGYKKGLGVFAVVLYKDGGMEYETMTTEEVNNTRNTYSKATNSKAWKSSWSEMARKTCLRRLCKHIECDFETVEAMRSWEDGSDLETNVVNRPATGDVVNPFEQMPEVQVEATVVDEITEEDVNELPDFMKGGE